MLIPVRFFSPIRPWLQLTATVLLALLTSLMPRAAFALSHRVVLIVTEAEGSAQPIDAHLLGALRGQLRELDVEVQVVRRPREPLAGAARRAQQIARAEHALGVIWLELPASGLSVFLYDASGHLYVRELAPDGSVTSQSEAVAIVLRSAIAALLEGDSVSMTEVQLPPPAPERAEPPAKSIAPVRTARPSAQHPYLRAGVSYVGTLFARRTRWQHGAGLALAMGPTESPWFFGLDYTFFSPVELESNGVRTRLQRHPIEALGGLQLRVRSLFFNVQAALSGDYLVRTTEQVSEGLLADPARGRWLLAMSTRLGVTVPIGGRVYGVLNLGADFLLNPFRQVVARSSAGDQVIGSPLLARPRAEVGLMIAVW